MVVKLQQMFSFTEICTQVGTSGRPNYWWWYRSCSSRSRYCIYASGQIAVGRMSVCGDRIKLQTRNTEPAPSI